MASLYSPTNNIYNMHYKAPVALFVYNRPDHTLKTIEALSKNDGAKNTILYIFSDAARSSLDANSVNIVREYIRKIEGFKKVIVVEQVTNLGLANSIISGVSSLCEKYGRVIVLEDDLETSPYFLSYMNDALDFYKDTKEVMNISGCRYPTEKFGLDDTFFLHVPLCWGWATWERAWVTFEKDINIMKHFDRKMIKRFNFDNSYSYWSQLKMNRSGAINTWFIFWYANLFLSKKLSLFPARSLVNNIGMDASGTHSGKTNEYATELSLTPIEIKYIPLNESLIGYEKHKKYFKSLSETILKRIIRKILLLFLRNIKKINKS